MLFNSFEFILVFLPIVLVGYYALGRYHNNSIATAWLSLASLCFYGWWNCGYLILLAGSIGINFSFSRGILRWKDSRNARSLLICAIIANITILFYYKYSRFSIDLLNQLAGTSAGIPDIILPLGISFFTFTQIAYLVDTYQGKAREASLMRYILFVSFFPHLIAGPILHHSEMMPQFADGRNLKWNHSNIAIGLSIFTIGLAKKIIIADSLGQIASPVFDAASAGAQLQLFECWIGTLSYTLQLYFDFSGYSEMAMGISLLFNIRLPLNFYSPYKAKSIIEFWRRWHMTLSRFLRNYLYIPLGGNRSGPIRRYCNIFITMLIGGIWHGAGLTFMAWGVLHGFFLIVNHLWIHIRESLSLNSKKMIYRLLAHSLTLICVMAGWAIFRSDSLTTAGSLLAGMAGMHGLTAPRWIAYPVSLLQGNGHFAKVGSLMTTQNGDHAAALVAAGLAIVLLMPNVMTIFRNCVIACETAENAQTVDAGERMGFPYGLRPFTWKESPLLGALLGASFALLVLLASSVKASEFLYYQF
jgi:alginate O-acetyltransferase complex protein AlgI